jgi:hypothetical protein
MSVPPPTTRAPPRATAFFGRETTREKSFAQDRGRASGEEGAAEALKTVHDTLEGALPSKPNYPGIGGEDLQGVGNALTLSSSAAGCRIECSGSNISPVNQQTRLHLHCFVASPVLAFQFLQSFFYP